MCQKCHKGHGTNCVLDNFYHVNLCLDCVNDIDEYLYNQEFFVEMIKEKTYVEYSIHSNGFSKDYFNEFIDRQLVARKKLREVIKQWLSI